MFSYEALMSNRLIRMKLVVRMSTLTAANSRIAQAARTAASMSRI